MHFLAESYFHTLDPFLIEFPKSWPMAGVRWYGVAYAAGFISAWGFMRWVAKRGWSPIKPEQVGDLIFSVILGVLLGGRLGYALFYDRELFYTFSNSIPFWNLLAINKGGMASHGGMIGVIFAVWWFGRSRGISSLHILDAGSLACTPGLFFGRIANFINGELHGRAIHDQINPPWWSMKFPEEMREWLPIKLESGSVVWEPDKLAGLSDVLDQTTITPAHWTSMLAEVAADPAHPTKEASELMNNLINFLVFETQNGNHAIVEALRPKLTAFYPSQVFQAISDGPILVLLLILIWLKPRKPGVVGSWFLIIYGVLRVITEFFRQPDRGVELTLGVLSRGQTLSLLMVLAGLVCLAIASRRNAAKLGGLFSRG